ncbi:MAG: family transcriptional regulator [Chlamydiia bacterium]|nr:family transcriptional regulator [Chlamydiia bacterium]
MSKQTKEEYEVTKDNIFADLGLDQPEELLARAKLLHEVGSLIKASNKTQKEVAVKLGITQPKVSMLVSGQLSAFSTDTLLHYLFILGCEVQIRIKKPRTRARIFSNTGHIIACC